MQNRVLGSFGSVVVTSTFYQEALALFYDLRWMYVAIGVLIGVDLWFGISESKMKYAEAYKKAVAEAAAKGEGTSNIKRDKVRKSSAGRRTCVKVVDYVAITILGAVLGMAIGETLGWFTHVHGAAIALAACALFELDSIKGHVCALHGIEDRFSVWAFVRSLVKAKAQDVGQAIEDATKDKDNGES